MLPQTASALVDRIFAEPPRIHAMDTSDDPALGVWSTDHDCYVLLAGHIGPGKRTLETGSGVSTVLFAAAGARHTSVTPAHAEADRILAYCAEQGIETGSLEFEIGCSDEVLPRLPDEQFDLILIDGNHGFPTPILDWYYAASRLRSGGLLVIDDIQLPAVAHLCAFIDRDPRWNTFSRSDKWIAFTRINEGLLRQDWFEQPSYAATSNRGLVIRAARKIRRRLQRRRQCLPEGSHQRNQ
jgi:predicted O-methyltransferase YrrM